VQGESHRGTDDDAIFVAIGANLTSPIYGPPISTCRAAVTALAEAGFGIKAVSRWYRSPPVPATDQPDFVNGVVRLETDLAPTALMDVLHAIEDRFGRRRSVPNAARVLDLDLIAMGRHVSALGEWPELPHPRLTERAFVLLPIADIAPHWKHPVSNVSVSQLIAALPDSARAVIRVIATA